MLTLENTQTDSNQPQEYYFGGTSIFAKLQKFIRNSPKVVGGIALVFMVAGVVAAASLARNNQDTRQQASGTDCPGNWCEGTATNRGSCPGSYYHYSASYCTNSGALCCSQTPKPSQGGNPGEGGGGGVEDACTNTDGSCKGICQRSDCGGCLDGKCINREERSKNTCNQLIDQKCQQENCGGNGVMLPSGQQCCTGLQKCPNGRCGTTCVASCLNSGSLWTAGGPNCCTDLVPTNGYCLPGNKKTCFNSTCDVVFVDSNAACPGDHPSVTKPACGGVVNDCTQAANRANDCQCTQNYQCATNYCNMNTAMCAVQPQISNASCGETCYSSSQCKSGLTCEGPNEAKRCRCSGTAVCSSGSCVQPEQITCPGNYPYSSLSECETSTETGTCDKQSGNNCWRKVSTVTKNKCSQSCVDDSQCATGLKCQGPAGDKRCRCQNGNICSNFQCIPSTSELCGAGNKGRCLSGYSCISIGGSPTSDMSCSTYACCMPADNYCNENSEGVCAGKLRGADCGSNTSQNKTCVRSGVYGNTCNCVATNYRCGNGSTVGQALECSGKNQKVCKNPLAMGEIQYESKACTGGKECDYLTGACKTPSSLSCPGCVEGYFFSKGMGCTKTSANASTYGGVVLYPTLSECITNNTCSGSNVYVGQRLCSSTENAVLTCANPRQANEYMKENCGSNTLCGYDNGDYKCVSSTYKCGPWSLSGCESHALLSPCSNKSVTNGTCLLPNDINPSQLYQNCICYGETTKPLTCTQGLPAPASGCTYYALKDDKTGCDEIPFKEGDLVAYNKPLYNHNDCNALAIGNEAVLDTKNCPGTGKGTCSVDVPTSEKGENLCAPGWFPNEVVDSVCAGKILCCRVE